MAWRHFVVCSYLSVLCAHREAFFAVWFSFEVHVNESADGLSPKRRKIFGHNQSNLAEVLHYSNTLPKQNSRSRRLDDVYRGVSHYSVSMVPSSCALNDGDSVSPGICFSFSLSSILGMHPSLAEYCCSVVQFSSTNSSKPCLGWQTKDIFVTKKSVHLYNIF